MIYTWANTPHYRYRTGTNANNGHCQSRVRSEGGRVARIGRIPYNAVDYR